MKAKIIITIISIGFISCRKQPEIPPAVINEPENITSIKITFTDSAGIDLPMVFEWKDPDGNGGQSPSIDSIILKQNKTYTSEITVLDESKAPIVDVSSEIKNEASEHQFFFKKTNINTTINYNDVDKNGNPLGLKTIWRRGASSSGAIEIILKHQPGVKVKSPGDANAGSSDIDITFITSIN